jgi:hypothetical protein
VSLPWLKLQWFASSSLCPIAQAQLVRRHLREHDYLSASPLNIKFPAADEAIDKYCRSTVRFSMQYLSQCPPLLPDILKLYLQGRLVILEPIYPLSAGSDPFTTPGCTVSQLNGLLDTDQYQPIVPPAFIPSNFGAASATLAFLNVDMMSNFNAHERTLVRPVFTYAMGVDMLMDIIYHSV